MAYDKVTRFLATWWMTRLTPKPTWSGSWYFSVLRKKRSLTRIFKQAWRHSQRYRRLWESSQFATFKKRVFFFADIWLRFFYTILSEILVRSHIILCVKISFFASGRFCHIQILCDSVLRQLFEGCCHRTMVWGWLKQQIGGGQMFLTFFYLFNQVNLYWQSEEWS